MTDTSESTPEAPHIAELRDKAEALPGVEADRDLYKLESAALRAGIDLQTRQGRGWAATYEGDWADTTAMHEDFEAFAGTTTAATPPSEPAAEIPPVEPPAAGSFNSGMTDELRKSHEGSSLPPGASIEPDPWPSAITGLNEQMRDGLPAETARRNAISKIIGAANAGDDRVLWSAQKHAQWVAESEG